MPMGPNHPNHRLSAHPRGPVDGQDERQPSQQDDADGEDRDRPFEREPVLPGQGHAEQQEHGQQQDPVDALLDPGLWLAVGLVDHGVVGKSRDEHAEDRVDLEQVADSEDEQ